MASHAYVANAQPHLPPLCAYGDTLAETLLALAALLNNRSVDQRDMYTTVSTYCTDEGEFVGTIY